MRVLLPILVVSIIFSGDPTPTWGQEQPPPLVQMEAVSVIGLEGEDAGRRQSQWSYFTSGFLFGALGVSLMARWADGSNAQRIIPPVAGAAGITLLAVRGGRTLAPLSQEAEVRQAELSPEFQNAFRLGYQRGIVKERNSALALGSLTGALVGLGLLLAFYGGA